jgi:hypothetical protein
MRNASEVGSPDDDDDEDIFLLDKKSKGEKTRRERKNALQLLKL